MRLILVAALLAMCLHQAYGAPVLDKNAVLTIWAQSAPDKSGIGTGFLISEDGQFLTCYHVIRNASKLTVYHGKTAYSDVQVIAVAPDHDLAVLRIMNLAEAAPYLPLSTDPPSRYIDEQLKVYGNPMALPIQQIPASASSPDYILSSAFRNPDGGDRIFELLDVKLIGLTMNVFNGLSGGPVISKSGVVGVISGSFKEGGTIAWAIPSEYASVSGMTPINRSLNKITSWPELSLMRRNNVAWSTLRFDVSMTAGVSLALDAYVSAVDEYDRRVQAAVVGAPGEFAELNTEFVRELKTAQTTRESPSAVSQRLSSYAQRARALGSEMPDRVKSVTDWQDVLLTRLNTLMSEVRAFQKALPDSPANRAAMAKSGASLLAVASNLQRGGAAFLDTMKAFGANVDRLYAHAPRNASQLRRQSESAVKLFGDASQRNASKLRPIIVSYRQIGDVAESLLDIARPESAQTTTADTRR